MLTPKVARRFARVDSTNAALLRDLGLQPDLPSGTVYLTRDQSAGRGQGSNGWHATPGDNLTLSALFRPADLSADRIFALTRATALAVADVVLELAPAAAADVRIKWPNDVYVGDRKVAGILIQNGLRGSRVSWSVIGIGLNVNEQHFPPELRSTATALHELHGAPLDTDGVLERLLTYLGRRLDTLDAGRFAELQAPYHDRLYLRDRPHTFLRVADDVRFRATVRGVDADGQLVLEHPDGRRETFTLQSLRFR
ncbi:biotin--[acetyl-CoA-carboxylase] ligase [Lewinella sp. IMCC34183]|uniref:biotin--[acetyl-CoA-carboxylase] ligase n=1 Tax=Lewinella sp. IMCC34183 TaxID=2248762 RepID=UPI000E288B2A|nr:biotin--[acetyl-CoA-carboxylase] ligase [Lewinella sp. IMCC34183]